MSVLTGVLAPFGNPAVATTGHCPGWTSTPQSVGVLGQEVFEAPALYLFVCVFAPSETPTMPTLEVTTTPARIVQLVHPDADYQEFKVYVSALVGHDPEDQVYRQVEVTVPADGGKTCLFFQGYDDYNPGGCAIFLSGNSTLNQTLNEVLEQLPLP